METVIASLVAAVPATIASVAAWRHAKVARIQTNSALHDPLDRIEAVVLDTQTRITRVETKVDKLEHHTH